MRLTLRLLIRSSRYSHLVASVTASLSWRRWGERRAEDPCGGRPGQDRRVELRGLAFSAASVSALSTASRGEKQRSPARRRVTSMTEPDTIDRRTQRLAKWREFTDLPLMMLAFEVIPLLLVEYTVDLTGTAKDAIEWSYAVIWLFFVADYVVELVCARDRRAFVRREWLALLVNVLTVPLPLLPAQLQVFRSVRLLRFFRESALERPLFVEPIRRSNFPKAPTLNCSSAVGTAARLVDILCARRGRAGRMSRCRRSSRRSSSVMWSRSLAGVI